MNFGFTFHMPVRIVSGSHCVVENKELWKCGTRCLIVTGRHSAVASGALDDVKSVLEANGTEYSVYDKISENPLVSVCYEGGQTAADFGADMIIGIGGGSALDAAKAIAAYAANPEVGGNEIYSASLQPSLPIIAIPTTAGTGSEANRYAVLSLDGENKKKTFTSAYSYPKYAFLDARYTASLQAEYTLSTALDAYCHCIESFLSPKSTDASALFALYGAKRIWEVLKYADLNALTEQQRASLLYASCAGGIAINTTGTGFPHPLGYNLTFYRGIPHGRACAAFTGQYVDFCMKSEEGAKRIADFCSATNASPDEIKKTIPALANVNVTLDKSEIALFIDKVKTAGNFKNCVSVISETDMHAIYSDLFIH